MRIFLSFILVFSTLISFGQNRKFVAKDSIAGKFSNFSVDNFGRVYLCQEDVILQYFGPMDTIYSTSLKTMRPTSMESTKSFRTLLFDQERSVIHFLDNTLTDIHGEIDLVNIGLQQPILVCESFAGNTFWVLDGGLMNLVRVNNELEKVSQTENLFNLFENGLQPTQMFESNDYLYILVPGAGVAIFDVFGTFIKMYPTIATRIGAMSNYLLLMYEDRIEAVSNLAFMDVDFVYPLPKNVTDFMFSNQKAYFLTKSRLIIGEYQRK